jgi:hypothetical protein
VLLVFATAARMTRDHTNRWSRMLANIVKFLVYGVTGTPTISIHKISMYRYEDICVRLMAGSIMPVRNLLVARMTFTNLLTNRQYLPSPEL